MTRKAVVIVPSEEDYKARTEAQKKEESNDVPDNAVMEMKGEYPHQAGNPVSRGIALSTMKWSELTLVTPDIMEQYPVKILDGAVMGGG